MGIFWNTTKPHVSQKEFQKTLSELYSKGFTHSEIDKIKEIFLGNFNQSNSEDKGIDKKELEKMIAWLREHKSVHGISDNHINILETELLERI